MTGYTWKETAAMLIAAIVIDWIVGDPRRLPHPVIWIGRFIHAAEKRLMGEPLPDGGRDGTVWPLPARQQRWKGVLLCGSTLLASGGLMWLALRAAQAVHPWLGYAVNTWFISTTIAVKGLKDAAYAVYRPLQSGDLPEARKYVGYIVGRDTKGLDEGEITRAAVETVAENTVDAVVSPLFYAFLGGAPLAMLYRAANTLDSMVGYRNARYRCFGWASARLDDVLNWIPARLTGFALLLAALPVPRWSARRALRSMMRFAAKHPSPNSGVPESAVAGALGIELGGTNVYGDVVSERARMGWPLRERNAGDIREAVRLLYGVSFIIVGGLLCALAGLWS